MNQPNNANIRTILHSKAFIIIGIIIVALTLRAPITSVGPLISSIQLDINISGSLAGLLTTLPLIAFAIFSPIAPKISIRIGNELSIFIGLNILIIGMLIRSTGGTVSFLIAGTFLIGIGIATCNVLLPSIIKNYFPNKIGLMTSVYTTSMGVCASIASGLSVPFAYGLDFGWQNALFLWAFVPLLAIIVWIPQIQSGGQTKAVGVPLSSTDSSLWRSKLAWQITCLMGCQSILFYSLVTWLPAILSHNGISESLAGWMLSIMIISGLPTSFLVPILAIRFANQQVIIFIIGCIYMLGMIGLFIGGNLTILVVCIMFVGLCQGATVSLALTLLGLRTKNSKQAAGLSGMVQSIGYLFAATGPFLIGFLYDTTQSWTFPMIVFLMIILLMIWVGSGSGRNKYVLD